MAIEGKILIDDTTLNNAMQSAVSNTFKNSDLRDKEVIMFDGPSYYTPSKVYIWDCENSKFKGNVVID